MMHPKLVIFDCDGVLVDSEGATTTILAAFFNGYGLDVSPDQVHSLFVGGTLQSAGEEAIRLGAKMPEGWLDDLSRQIIGRMAKGVPLIPGVRALIDQIEAAGSATAVASNGAMAKMQASLSPHGLYQHFGDRIFSCHEHGAPKPAPDLIYAAMAQAGVTAQETVFIDDSPSGCKAGIAAGVRTFGFAVEGQGDRLAAVGGEVVDSMEEIGSRLGFTDR